MVLRQVTDALEPRRRLALAGYSTALLLLTIELGRSDRLPLPIGLLVVGFVTVHMGVGLLLGAWRWIWLGLLLVVAVVAAAVLAGDGLVVVAAVPAVPLGMAGIAGGVGLRRVIDRRRAAGPLGVTGRGAVLLAVAWLPPPDRPGRASPDRAGRPDPADRHRRANRPDRGGWAWGTPRRAWRPGSGPSDRRGTAGRPDR